MNHSEANAVPCADAQPPRITQTGLFSAILVGLVGAMVIFITPGFLAVIAQMTGFDDDQLGYLVAWDINAMAVAIGLSTFALARVSWRKAVALGLALIILGNVLTVLLNGFEAIVAARVVAGSGAGIAIGFSFAALGRAKNPDRAFSVYLVVGYLLASAYLYAMPSIMGAITPQTQLLIFAGINALVLLSLGALPDGSKDEVDIFAEGGKIDLPYSAGALISVFLLFFAVVGVWSYSERIGAASNLSPEVIATGLSVGTMAGVLGAGLAGVLPRVWGRAIPITLSGIACLIGFLLYRGDVSPTAFTIATVLTMLSWNFSQPLLSGLCSEACSRGRVVCAMGSIQTFGSGLGPAVAAATLVSGSFDLMIYGACATLILSVVIAVATTTRARKIS
ncbi:MFS transporter [Aurantiacibacter rhizosphaerae]|uniref:MFS transporter n=1 Tax=Aurantiacibacter rhizosphaerae TaxID=2691582 RepID=A0A844XB30_9SPHN|nr:MFS transporter [Aurantiacibacter rhizosphaerae]MWV26844.1 MFS transporter [Aurantiacibacter rhizosphaerae]